MKPIPQSYKQAGYTMTLVRREGNIAMYADPIKSYYEVHQVRVAKMKELFGRTIEEHETLASSEEFGNRAFACSSLEVAESRFAELRSRPSEVRD